jgi:hypothetical protein
MPGVKQEQREEVHIAEDPLRANDLIETADSKEFSEHVEDAEDQKKGVRDVEYDDQEGDATSRTGMRRLLRRNPSYNFIREVAMADEEPLDQVQVKRVSLAALANRFKERELISPSLRDDFGG